MKLTLAELDAKLVREVLHYEARTTGRLIWKRRGDWWFKSNNSWSSWNSRYADREAFTSIHTEGYKCGTLFGCSVFAHRIAYLHFHGHLPEGIIDHWNRDKTDNRIGNLRDATWSENLHNCGLRANNKSGFTGVWWDEEKERWKASIMIDGERFSQTFTSQKKAIAFRRMIAKDWGVKI